MEMMKARRSRSLASVVSANCLCEIPSRFGCNLGLWSLSALSGEDDIIFPVRARRAVNLNQLLAWHLESLRRRNGEHKYQRVNRPKPGLNPVAEERDWVKVNRFVIKLTFDHLFRCFFSARVCECTVHWFIPTLCIILTIPFPLSHFLCLWLHFFHFERTFTRRRRRHFPHTYTDAALTYLASYFLFTRIFMYLFSFSSLNVYSNNGPAYWRVFSFVFLRLYHPSWHYS